MCKSCFPVSHFPALALGEMLNVERWNKTSGCFTNCHGKYFPRFTHEWHTISPVRNEFVYFMFAQCVCVAFGFGGVQRRVVWMFGRVNAMRDNGLPRLSYESRVIRYHLAGPTRLPARWQPGRGSQYNPSAWKSFVHANVRTLSGLIMLSTGCCTLTSDVL